MKQYKYLFSLLKALESGRVKLPKGKEVVLEMQGNKILSQKVQKKGGKK